jgi:DNA-binding IclR family transcriptional regulator
VRAAVLKSISEEPQKSGQILARLPYPSERIDKALVDLEREGFVVQNKRGTFSVVGS